jgi:hypothetical protein
MPYYVGFIPADGTGAPTYQLRCQVESGGAISAGAREEHAWDTWQTILHGSKRPGIAVLFRYSSGRKVCRVVRKANGRKRKKYRQSRPWIEVMAEGTCIGR